MHHAGGLKPKDLVGIPWRVAFALQADGWYLRSDIIWHKPNPIPESVTDRCTKAHEYLFLLTKSAKYFYDAEAIKEAQSNGSMERFAEGRAPRKMGPKAKESDRSTVLSSYETAHGIIDGGRNKRSVWTIPTAPFKYAHFATFPPGLVRPCVLAGTSAKGCCPGCGASWVRVLSKERVATRPGENTKVKVPGGWDVAPGSHGTIHRDGRTEATYRDAAEVGNRDPGRHVTESALLGWRPGCKCAGSHGPVTIADLLKWQEDMLPVPCVVLDPFGGSGTVGQVAAQEGRDYVLIEINPKYVAMAREVRLAAVETGVPVREARNGQMPLFSELHPSSIKNQTSI